jgi:hypothetical protein
MKIALSFLVGLPLAMPFLGGGHALTRTQVEQRLQSRMNGSSAGHITRRVGCAPTVRVDRDGSLRYRCSLVGANGSKQHVVVHVSGRSWRADWAPVTG